MNRTRATRPISGSWRRTTPTAAASLVATHERRPGQERTRVEPGRANHRLPHGGGRGLRQPAARGVPAAGGEPRILTAGSTAGSTRSGTRATASGCISCSRATAAGSLRACVRATAGWSACSKGPVPRLGIRRRGSGDVVARIENANDAPELYVLGKGGRRGGSPTSTTRTCARWRSATRTGSSSEPGWHTDRGVRDDSRPASIRSGGIRRSCDIHGGPVSRFAYGYDFGAQYLAANGYVVVAAESTWLDRPRPGLHPRDLPHLGHHGLRRSHRRGRPRHRPRLRRSRTGSRHRLLLRRLHDQHGHHAHGSLQGRGLGRRAQLDRGQLRSRHLPEVVQLGARRALGESGSIRPAFAADAGRQGHDADDLPRRPRRLERAGAERRAFLPVAAVARHRHAARRVPGHAPWRTGARNSRRTICVACGNGSTST